MNVLSDQEQAIFIYVSAFYSIRALTTLTVVDSNSLVDKKEEEKTWPYKV